MGDRRVLEDRLGFGRSMILCSVSDSSIDSQMASAACPAASETLLMASSCERIRGTGRQSRPRSPVLATGEDYPFESGARLI